MDRDRKNIISGLLLNKDTCFKKVVRFITSISLFVQIVIAPLVSLPSKVNADAFSITIIPYDKFPPEPVTDLVAVSVSSRTSEGLINLTWTIPREDRGVPSSKAVSEYRIRYSTYSIEELGGDTTAWWEQALIEFTVYEDPSAKPGNKNSINLPALLPPGVTWFFAIKSLDDAVPVPLSSLIDTMAEGVTTQARVLGCETDFAPWTPQGLTALYIGVSSITLSWTDLTAEGKTTDFDFYQILRSTTPGEYGVIIDTTSLTALTDISVQQNVTYYYRIRAVDQPPYVLYSEVSQPVTCYVKPFDTTPPQPVTDLLATTLAQEAQILLSWTAPVETGSGLKEYYIKSSLTSIDSLGGDTTAWWNNPVSSWTVVANVLPGNTEQFIITWPDLYPGNTYYFAIKAADKSNYVSVIDVKASSPAAQAYAWARDIRPATPQGLTILDATTSFVKLSWTDLTGAEKTLDFDYYRIYRSTDPASIGQQIAPVFITPTECDDTGVLQNTTYYYRISAVDKPPLILESPLSEPVTCYIKAIDIRPPDAITDLLAITTSNEAEIQLIWTAPYEDSSGIKEYYIKYATFSITQLGNNTTSWWISASSCPVLIATVPSGNTEQFVINYPDLVPGLTYYFAVRSIDRAGNLSVIDVKAQAINQQAKAWSRDIPPSTPQNFALIEATTGHAKLSWTDLTDVEKTLDFDRYKIYRSVVPGQIGQEITPVFISATTCEDRSIITNTTYYYRISAVDKEPVVLESELSQPVTFYVQSEDKTPPQPVTDLFAEPVPNPITVYEEATIRLSWTAPVETESGLKEYYIRFNQYPVPWPDMGDNTTSWWLNAYVSTMVATRQPGNLEITTFTYTSGGLIPGVSYYFAIKSIDNANNLSLIDIKSATPGEQACAWSVDLPPARPTGLTASATNYPTMRVDLQWPDLTSMQKTLDFTYYRVYRANAPGTTLSDYQLIGYTRNVVGGYAVFTDTSVVANRTYYYVVTAVDDPPLILESMPSEEVAVRIDVSGRPPREPYGLTFNVNGNKVEINWKPVQFNYNGTPCTDLAYYVVYRSTSMFGNYTNIATTNQTSFTDNINQGDVYYYYITAIDTEGFESYHSAIVDTNENITFTSFDNSVYTTIPKKIYDLAERNLIIEFTRNTSEEQGRIIQSYEYKMYEDYSLVRTPFGQPVTGNEYIPYQYSRVETTLAMKYRVINNEIASFDKSKNRINAVPANQADKVLSIFWFNGTKWINLGGDVDMQNQVVTVKITTVGKYQLRQVIRTSGFVQDPNSPYPKIITPNGDGRNDSVFFKFVNTTGEKPIGKIYDITGTYVSDITVKSETVAEWDGKDYLGRTVPAGVYVYQVECANEMITGTVVVAK